MRGASNKKNCSHYWFLDTHFAVSFWVKIDDVVTAVVVAAVHQHRVQDVVSWVLGVWLLEKLVKGQLIWKLKPVEEWGSGRSRKDRQEEGWGWEEMDT